MSASILSASVLAAVAPLRAACKDERDLLRLISALANVAEDFRTEREEMPSTDNVQQCCDCGCEFSITITVKRERESHLPMNCPRCYHASTGNVSYWADKVTYLETKSEDSHA